MLCIFSELLLAPLIDCRFFQVSVASTFQVSCTSPGDSELLTLLAQEAIVQAEHEELLSMNHDLMRKLQAERAEIMRLREEIQEMQTLYGYR